MYTPSWPTGALAHEVMPEVAHVSLWEADGDILKYTQLVANG